MTLIQNWKSTSDMYVHRRCSPSITGQFMAVVSMIFVFVILDTCSLCAVCHCVLVYRALTVDRPQSSEGHKEILLEWRKIRDTMMVYILHRF
jgi:hypothetical protein